MTWAAARPSKLLDPADPAVGAVQYNAVVADGPPCCGVGKWTARRSELTGTPDWVQFCRCRRNRIPDPAGDGDDAFAGQGDAVQDRFPRKTAPGCGGVENVLIGDVGSYFLVFTAHQFAETAPQCGAGNGAGQQNDGQKGKYGLSAVSIS